MPVAAAHPGRDLAVGLQRGAQDPVEREQRDHDHDERRPGRTASPEHAPAPRRRRGSAVRAAAGAPAVDLALIVCPGLRTRT